jgi:photosystem II stability/assembly factor-like uncharacterized protein
MAMIKATTLIFLALLLTNAPLPTGGAEKEGSGPQKSYYAAVFINRGHVSGGGAPNVGVFRRGSENDTQWANIYRPNLLTFGIAFWDRGSARRFYVASGSGLHRSLDGGRTWRVLTDWHTEEILSVALDPVDSAVIYIGTPSGFFRSTDDGSTWQKKIQGLKKQFIKMVVMDYADRASLFAASEDDLYRTTDRGEHWAPLRVGVSGILTVLQHPSNPKCLFVGTEDNGVRLSVDGGKTWNPAGGLPNTAIYSICISPDKKTLFAGGYRTGLWKSDDGGFTWGLLWQSSDLEAIFSIFVDPDNLSHLMIGTSGQGIYESLNQGKTWRATGLQGCHVKQIALYPEGKQ